MSNRNYINGRAREYRMMKLLKDKFQCHHVFRSAGSHSAIDVIGINLIEKRIYLFQCKPKSLSIPAKLRLEDENELLNGKFEVTFQVV